MKPLPSFVLPAVLTALLVPLPASAQPTRVELRDPFFAGTEFGTRALDLGGRSANIDLPRGGRVEASLEFIVDCGERCSPRDQSQLVVGFAGAPEAQACIWQGAGSTNGWLAAKFALEVPNAPGVYEVRARKTRAPSCREAIAQWKNHRGNDPSIGLIVVDTGGQPTRGDRRQRREIRELQRAFDATLERQEQIQRQLLDLSSRPANAKRTRDINALTRESITLTRDLRDIQSELREELEERANPSRQPPRVLRPTVVMVADPDPFPVGMPPHEFQDFLGRVQRATFPNHQINAIKDTLVPGVLLGLDQAKAILGKFAHESHKVEVVSLLCPHIIERNALPPLLAMFTFESYRQQAREQTGGRCGGAL